MAGQKISKETIGLIIGVIVAVVIGIVSIVLLVTNDSDSSSNLTYSKKEREQYKSEDLVRMSDLAEVVTALNTYRANNRGALPSDSRQWDRFVSSYLNDIVSPDVTYYKFVEPCAYDPSGSNCKTPKSLNWENDKNIIYFAKYATCDPDSESGLSFSTNSRRVAIYTPLRLQKYYCVDN